MIYYLIKFPLVKIWMDVDAPKDASILKGELNSLITEVSLSNKSGSLKFTYEIETPEDFVMRSATTNIKGYYQFYNDLENLTKYTEKFPEGLIDTLKQCTIKINPGEIEFILGGRYFKLVSDKHRITLLHHYEGTYVSTGCSRIELANDPKNGILKAIKRALAPTYTTVEIKCPHCNKSMSVKLTFQQLKEVKKGRKLITQIFPNESADYRELFISGTCSECWDKLMKPRRKYRKRSEK